jgi:hypothetical protein
VDCAVSMLDSTIGCVTAPSVTGVSTGGFGVSTVAAREELAFVDRVIAKTVAGSVGCLGCLLAPPKSISSPTCRVLSQRHEEEFKEANCDWVHR